jgi:predicted esterase YcpF (UPF0227 family)
MCYHCLMQNCVVYISGLFEDLNGQLFLRVNNFLQKNQYVCEGIELYQGAQFGAYSFQNEIERIQKIVDKHNPILIIAHSLGGYVSLHLKLSCPVILLDPSLSISDIFLSNLKIKNGKSFYEDKEVNVKISHEFVESLKQTLSIEKLTKISGIKKVHIVGAGLGGYRVAEQYHAALLDSSYTFLPNAGHDFLDVRSTEEIMEIIKKQLGIKPSCD